MKPRHLLLGAALAATLAASFWPEPEVLTAMPHRADKPRTAAIAKPQAPAPAASGLGSMQADLFPSQTWQPPARPKPVAARAETRLPPPPATPTPPPLPFAYLGRWKQAEQTVYFIGQGERVLSLKPGDTEIGWHFDQAGDDTLTFTWTALNMQRTLRITP
jgi:hypothetical protein